jgi:hypothetical protein
MDGKYTCEKIVFKILDSLDMEESNIGQINKNNYTALIVACSNKLEKVALKILKYPKECNIGHITKNGYTALTVACCAKLNCVALKILEYPNKIFHGNSKKYYVRLLYWINNLLL